MAKVRTGFTLRELMVVMTILCLLLALLSILLNSKRETTSSDYCKSNLRQLGIALQSYHSVWRTYPAGAYWEGNSSDNKGSILLRLSCHLGNISLYNQVDFTRGTDDQILSDGTPLCSKEEWFLRCRADRQSRLSGNVAFSNYSASHGSSGLSNNPDCFCKNDWNKFAQVPYEQTSGMFTRLGKSYSDKDCLDGLSHTIFFGEVLPDCSVHVQNGWTRTNNSQGLCSTIIPINYDSCQPMGKGDACHQPCNWSTELGFRSNHVGGCFFTMGDASVRFLSEDIDHQVYQYLGGARDGHGKGLR